MISPEGAANRRSHPCAVWHPKIRSRSIPPCSPGYDSRCRGDGRRDPAKGRITWRNIARTTAITVESAGARQWRSSRRRFELPIQRSFDRCPQANSWRAAKIAQSAHPGFSRRVDRPARFVVAAASGSRGIEQPLRGRDRPCFEKDRASPESADIGRNGRVLDTILNVDRNLAWGLRSPLSGDMPKNRVRFTKGAACLISIQNLPTNHDEAESLSGLPASLRLAAALGGLALRFR